MLGLNFLCQFGWENWRCSFVLPPRTAAPLHLLFKRVREGSSRSMYFVQVHAGFWSHVLCAHL